MATEKNPRREFVNTIVESMKGRDNAWQQTWKNMAEVGTPYNPTTGTQYKGINFLSLAIEQTKLRTKDPRWCTFDQAVEAKFKIPKNTKASHAHFYDLKVTLNRGDESYTIKAKNNNEYISNIIALYRDEYPDKAKEIKTALSKANELKPTINSDKGKIALFVGELNKATGSKIELVCFPVMKSFPIFNYSQLENVPELEIKQVNKAETLNRAEGILVASGAKIKHSDENFYNPEKHEINLKEKDSFKSPEAYYSTALQEVAHWTIVDDVPFQPDYKIKDEPDDLAFAREELRAELANIFISSELGLDFNVQDRPSHNGAYMELLNDDYQELFTAVTHANKIATHVLNFEKRLDLESEVAKELQSENPKLYKKIEAFKAQELGNESTHEQNDSPKKSSNKLAEKHKVVDKDIDQANSSKDDKNPHEKSQQKPHVNKVYLETFFEEKELPLKEFVINHKGEDNFITNEVVIDYIINSIDPVTQGKIKDTLVKLDFKNGDINNFLEHCAKGMVLDNSAVIESLEVVKDYSPDIDAPSNIDAREFKNHEIEQELKNESKSQHDDSVTKVKEVKEKIPTTIDNDNDFSI